MSEFIHFLDEIFKDDRISKLDCEVYWRICCSTRKGVKSQSVLCEWTQRGRGTISKSLKRLCDAGYLEQEGRAYCLPSVSAGNQNEDENDSSGNQNDSARKQNDSSRKICTTLYKKHKELVNNTPPSTPPEKIKKPGTNFPRILLSDEEKEKLIARYSEEGLSLEVGLQLFDGWAEDNPGKFKKKKSHYRCLLGWVLERCLELETKRLKLEREKSYHQGRR